MKLSIELSPYTREDGRSLIRLVIHHHGRARYTFPVAVERSRWDNRNRRVRPGGNAVEINRTIAAAMARAEVLALDGGSTARTIVDELARTGPDGAYPLLSDAVAKAATTHTERYSEGTRVAFGTLVPNIREHLAKVRLDELTPQHVQHFSRSLAAQGLASNTVRRRLKLLRMGYHVACGDMKLDPAPVFKNNIPKEVPTARRKMLDDAQLERLCALSINVPEIMLAKHTFILQVFLGGMRIGDAIALRSDALRTHNGRLELDYNMGKTGAAQWVPVPTQAADVIDHYKGGEHVLPLYTGPGRNQIGGATARVNRSLKVIAQLCDLPPGLSTHYARHTFGDWARREGIDLKTLQMIFRHKSINTTMVYMASFGSKEVSDAYERLARSMPEKVV